MTDVYFKFTCKGCKNRKVGCHATCETYMRERKKYESMKAEASKDDDFRLYTQESISRRLSGEARKQRRLLGITKYQK